MRQRLIASDLDGTLFGDQSVPEPRTVAAVNAVVDAGYVFAAVTGRSHFTRTVSCDGDVRVVPEEVRRFSVEG